MELPEPGKCLAIFVVEDETLIKMMIVEMLEELGHRASCEAARLDQAVIMASTAEFDLALLDVNLAGNIVTPVAEIIDGRKRPIVFATGYGPAGLPAVYRDRPCIRKPFTLETLRETINHAMAHQARSMQP